MHWNRDSNSPSYFIPRGMGNRGIRILYSSGNWGIKRQSQVPRGLSGTNTQRLKCHATLPCTVICRCINTPVKRQYINAIFEVTWNNRKRVATDFNFLSFIYIEVKGFSSKFGKRIFTGFEMPDHESYTSTFFQYFTT